MRPGFWGATTLVGLLIGCSGSHSATAVNDTYLTAKERKQLQAAALRGASPSPSGEEVDAREDNYEQSSRGRANWEEEDYTYSRRLRRYYTGVWCDPWYDPWWGWWSGWQVWVGPRWVPGWYYTPGWGWTYYAGYSPYWGGAYWSGWWVSNDGGFRPASSPSYNYRPRTYTSPRSTTTYTPPRSFTTPPRGGGNTPPRRTDTPPLSGPRRVEGVRVVSPGGGGGGLPARPATPPRSGGGIRYSGGGGAPPPRPR